MNRSLSMSAALAVTLLAGVAAAQTRVNLVIAQGQTLPNTGGLTATTLNDPYVNGLGQVGFTGASSGGNFVWYDTGVTWLNSQATSFTLTGAEGTMGISNTGGFIYSPTATPGGDAVWSQSGILLNEEDALPHIPGKFSSFNSRPRMSDDGSVIWPAGIRDTQTGTTSNRAFFRVADPANPMFETLIIGGGTYGGLTITMTASNFAYDVSGNGRNRIHNLSATGATATDSFMYLSTGDLVVGREGSAVPGFPAENYVAFRIPAVNNSNDWAFAADTNAATTSDEIIIHNGAVLLREGAAITGGGTFAGTVNAVSINNTGKLAFIYSGATGNPEALVSGPVASFAADARRLLAVGDSIDTDGDGACDYALSDFEASNGIAPGLDIPDQPYIYVQVSLTPCGGGTAIEAIIRVPDGCGADFNQDGTVDFFDYLDFVDEFSNNSPSADFNGDGVVDFFDYLDFVDAFSIGC